ncbi:MAG: lipoprotein [Gammaproteobacteria bacterium]|nr:lipoprotein [Gammaproteobacteria bacterium]
MRRFIATLMSLCLLAVLLAGCGQKGPLYFPDEDEERKQVSS